jgi:hypothetical protein
VNLYLCAQFPKVLNDIPGKGIIVVDHQNHGDIRVGSQIGDENAVLR